MTCIKWSNLVLILAAYDVFDIVTKMVDALKDKKKKPVPRLPSLFLEMRSRNS